MKYFNMLAGNKIIAAVIIFQTLAFIPFCVKAFIDGVDNAGKTAIASAQRLDVLSALPITELANIRVEK